MLHNLDVPTRANGWKYSKRVRNNGGGETFRTSDRQIKLCLSFDWLVVVNYLMQQNFPGHNYQECVAKLSIERFNTNPFEIAALKLFRQDKLYDADQISPTDRCVNI